MSAALDYSAFLSRKGVSIVDRGLADVPSLAGHLFPFQRQCVEFLLRAGSGGLFLDTGLGKTAIELEWASHAAEATNGRALILTPLAVARQIEREGLRWGYSVRVIREQEESGDGINVCNYDRLDRLDCGSFGAVSLDESSILKSFTGKTSRALIAAFAGHRFRLSATATPAPNDHMELGQHSEFCGVMPQADMLIRWFKNDSGDTGQWRIKGHAASDFWDWMARWSRMAGHPRDLGDDVAGFDLPPVKVMRHEIEEHAPTPGSLFGAIELSATDMHRVKRATADARARKAAELVGDGMPWVVWVDTDYEADAVIAALGDASDVREVRGSDVAEHKEAALAAFADGSARVIVTKPSIAGWGLNWQHCSRMVFVGRSFSYEMAYQAVRRCWRFGQRERVNVHLIVADGEAAIARVLDRKAESHDAMKREMVAAMGRAAVGRRLQRVAYEPRHAGRLPSWLVTPSGREVFSTGTPYGMVEMAPGIFEYERLS